MRSARSGRPSSSACAGSTAHRPPAGPRVTVHGDFRIGNLLVGPDGLRGVLDWELAHAGDPAEDIGWLCAPAWRFGGTGEVGGFGALARAPRRLRRGGRRGRRRPARVHWWQVYATVKWATICALQASAHLSGATRSVELAAIGRRVCESEWDLFALLGVAPPPADRPDEAGGGRPDVPPFGRPTAAELVEAVREYLEATSMERSRGRRAGSRPGWRATRSAIVERELRLGPGHRRGARRAPGRARLRRRRRAGRRPPLRRARRATWGCGGAGAGRVGPRPAAGGEPLLLAAGRRRRARQAGRDAGSVVAGSADSEASAASVAWLPMPWRSRPASRLQAIMKIQAWWKAPTAAAPVAVAEDGDEAGHAEGDADLAASWRRGRSRWRSAAAATVPWPRRRARAA